MQIDLLYWGRSWGNVSPRGKAQFEYHPYCQLEVCEKGRIVMCTSGGDFIMQAGDILLIPPGVGHHVVYPDSGNEFYSLKFEASEVPEKTVLFPHCQFNNWLIKSLHECHLEGARHAMPITCENREIIEGVLAMTMQRFCRQDARKKNDEPEIFKKIRNAALITASSINVESCAELLGMNAAQLNYQFAKGLKEFGWSAEDHSVKKLIDQAILYLIDQYLDFTSFSLSAIARQMKFNNVYTFSRYYKRLTGISPSERRKKQR